MASVPPALPLPEALTSLVDALLAKDPTARPSAAEAAAGLRRLGPSLSGVAALTAQPPPADFDSARGPMTMLRGVVPDQAPATPVTDHGESGPRSASDLGTPDRGTMLRPMAVPTVREEARREPAQGSRKKPPKWRDPRALALVAAALVLLGGAVAYATTSAEPPPEEEPPPATATPVEADQQDTPTPTGLTVSRNAVYDPQAESVQLTITYTAQNSELGGPFLEVLPDTGSGCATGVTWQDGDQQPNLPSDLRVDCGWSVDPGPVPEQGSATVTANVPLTFEGDDATTALQEWLDTAAGSTFEAVTDSEVSSVAYPAQRLQGVEVVAPPSPVSNQTLPLTILPVWPSGPDQLNPLYRSPSMGEPTTLLTAVAGGEEGVRFSDGCSGALLVSADRRVVIASDLATDCSVITTVGNITDVPSNTFDIVTRGS